MMIKPAIEEMAKKTGNKYVLCNVVSKRAKEIQKSKYQNEMQESGEKEITAAANELENDQLKVTLAD